MTHPCSIASSMTRLRHRPGTAALFGLSLLLAPLATTPSAHAADVNASDYMPAPAGTNLFLLYNQYATRSSYESTSGVTYSNNTSLDSYIDILRYVHYFDIGGFTVAPQVLVPVGTLYNASINGADLGAAAGLADPIVAATVWVVNNKETQTYIGVMPYLFLPIGQYNAQDALNMGENRWKLDLQTGWYQGLGHGFALQLTGDVTWYGDNTDAGGGGQTLSQDNTYQVQAWLSYAFAETWQAAVGYSGYWGGDEYLNGIATGNATRKDQVRLELSKFITPTFQVLGLIQRDFNTEGGFPEDFRGTVRLMQVF